MSTSFEELIQANGLAEPELGPELAVWLSELVPGRVRPADRRAGEA